MHGLVGIRGACQMSGFWREREGERKEGELGMG